jgi:ATP-dependent helicase/nuclease subunit B
MPLDSPRVFSIPSGTPFLDTLARSLVADPALRTHFSPATRLEDITILLPTRRACRALADAFLRAGDGRALLLPAIHPLGDIDEEGQLLEAAGFGEEELSLPPAISPLERQLRLARYILAQWRAMDAESAEDAPRALALAAELGNFLDMAATERVALTALQSIVPDEFAENWQITVEFLKILSEHWPTELQANGLMDHAVRRNLLLENQAKRWAAAAPKGPVIAAGSTGSIPATADLLKVIASLPQGALILPGLDMLLDGPSWDELALPRAASHPQYGLAHLLRHLQLARDDVALWPGVNISPAQSARAGLFSEVLRPAETTSLWREQMIGLDPERALAGLSLVEAPDRRVEAAAIALMLRETLETPGKTAALVTPDRVLARRVAVEMRRWNIEIDDSGGLPLRQTPPVVFLRLVADMLAENLAPVPLLACLKHPLAALGYEPSYLRQLIRKLEGHVLRGPRPAPGIEGLRAALEHWGAEQEERKRSLEDFTPLSKLLIRLEDAIVPLSAAFAMRRFDLASLLRAHMQVAEQIAATDKQQGASRLWDKEAGEAASEFLQGALNAAPILETVETHSYPHLFTALVGSSVLRPRYGNHPRLSIWGPLEARLQHADRIILGGLNEGTWPMEANIDPWLSRPMRAALGIEPPERRIGLAAHDFAEGAAASEVILTRAAKVDGAPAVASRWVLRLQSLLEGMKREKALHATHWVEWALALDQPDDFILLAPPRPTPPHEARPKRYSVTEIETLIRDPYAIYARRILGLELLDPLDDDIGAADRGSIIHKALENFTRAFPGALPENALAELTRIGRETFAEILDRPGVAAFWWPRFLRVAQWMLEWEGENRPHAREIHAELRGEIEVETGRGAVRLVAKADRIDRLKDGSLRILDYKTGQPPSEAQVKQGLSPQLPLEAAMAARGAFKELGEAITSELLYLRLSGGDPAGEEKVLASDAALLAEESWKNLLRLLQQFETAPYLSRPRPMFEVRFGDYDHLARVKEWSASGEGSA